MFTVDVKNNTTTTTVLYGDAVRLMKQENVFLKYSLSMSLDSRPKLYIRYKTEKTARFRMKFCLKGQLDQPTNKQKNEVLENVFQIDLIQLFNIFIIITIIILYALFIARACHNRDLTNLLFYIFPILAVRR